jgi:hypothetical protein
MRSICLGIASALVIALGAPLASADHHEELVEQLKPLQFMVGNWASDREADGVTWKGSYTTAVEADGHVLRSSGTLRRDGEVAMSWVTLTYPKAGSKEFAFFSIGSTGRTIKGTGTVAEGSLTLDGTTATDDGESRNMEIVMKKVDDDTFSMAVGRMEISWKRVK